MPSRGVRLLVLAAATLSVVAGPHADQLPNADAIRASQSTALENAHREFYNGRYEPAAELTRDLCTATVPIVAACELRTTALLFQLKNLVGGAERKDAAWERCVRCAGLLVAFQSALATGQSAARARLQTHPEDETMLFLLGKLDLNHVWLQLGVRGKKTGWGEYWEARHALDAVLMRNPNHVRARVARAWIDYIVDTKMPRGTRWLLGGGNRKRGLRTVAQAADADASFFVRAEARFALWDMHVRERNVPAAVAAAVDLARDFPQNQELNKFIETHQGSGRP